MDKDRLVFENLPDIEALALTLYGEARGEPLEGKLAVAYVIVNRSILWKKGIKHIVFAKNQFSCFLKSDYNYPILLNLAKAFDANLVKNNVLQVCLGAAEMATSSPEESTVGKATFYRVTGNKNKWFDNAVATGKLKETVRIGHHSFYEETA